MRDKLIALLRESFDPASPWLPKGFNIEGYAEKLLARAEFLMWFDATRPVGLIAYYCNNPDHDFAFITIVVVAESHRRRKIANSLLNAVLTNVRARAFRRCLLEVEAQNTAAIAMYRNAGFYEIESKGLRLTMEIRL